MANSAHDSTASALPRLGEGGLAVTLENGYPELTTRDAFSTRCGYTLIVRAPGDTAMNFSVILTVNQHKMLIYNQLHGSADPVKWPAG